MMIQMRDNAAASPVGPPANRRTLTCEEFQAQMPELMGGRIRDHEHLKTCARCQALLEELEYIASIAGELMQPVYEPGDEVWKRITDSLEQDGHPTAKADARDSQSTRKP
jgi:hypothetical protein